ncbi:MAG: hypothetical protein A2W25_03135 [candidate division Zixibacteria bacterium RBG_16_53_22]|nr:MAG: hypothetical protein A2W25_03135 [candidate division Zixibacteria bacterium RBG_16_53_22]
MDLKIHWKHLLWLPINGAVAFLAPAALLGILGIGLGAYYIPVFVISTAVAIYYVKSSNYILRHQLKSGWALGIIFGIFIGLIFLSFASVSNPDLYREFSRPGAAPAIIKSIILGVAIAVLVTVLPFMIAWRSFGENTQGVLRKSLVTVAAIAAVAAVTFLYSLGLPGSLPGTDPSGHGDLQANFMKTMLAGVPTLISGSPLAAPISNVFLQLSESAARPDNQQLDSAEQSPTTSSGGIN